MDLKLRELHSSYTLGFRSRISINNKQGLKPDHTTLTGTLRHHIHTGYTPPPSPHPHSSRSRILRSFGFWRVWPGLVSPEWPLDPIHGLVTSFLFIKVFKRDFSGMRLSMYLKSVVSNRLSNFPTTNLTWGCVVYYESVLWIGKSRSKDKNYIWISVWWKDKK